jgi:murein endopeptidase
MAWSLPSATLRPSTLATAIALQLAGCSEWGEHETPLSAPETVSPDRPSAKKPRERSDDAITYTIARGGTLINVANLYKLHHHEIIELNPDLDPSEQLPPKTEVVVYDAREDSDSIGLPHDGRVVGGVPMLDGPGRLIRAERWKTWATRSTVTQLDRVLRQWTKVAPEGPPILVGNLSSRRGGALAPHKTHQSGRDVDLGYVAKWDGKSRIEWQVMNADTLDAGKTWTLLKTLVKSADVEVMFVDRHVQKLLLRYAQATGVVRKDKLDDWLQVAPGADPKKALIRHVAGHDDHLHVRFACRPDEKRCQS